MATIDLEIGARTYSIACRDGEEPHLLSVAAIVDAKARDAAAALGQMNEARQLLFASLLLADELKEQQGAASSTAPAAPAAEAPADPRIADALERLAERVEMLAESLEHGA